MHPVVSQHASSGPHHDAKDPANRPETPGGRSFTWRALPAAVIAYPRTLSVITVGGSALLASSRSLPQEAARAAMGYIVPVGTAVAGVLMVTRALRAYHQQELNKAAADAVDDTMRMLAHDLKVLTFRSNWPC